MYNSDFQNVFYVDSSILLFEIELFFMNLHVSVDFFVFQLCHNPSLQIWNKQENPSQSVSVAAGYDWIWRKKKLETKFFPVFTSMPIWPLTQGAEIDLKCVLSDGQ